LLTAVGTDQILGPPRTQERLVRPSHPLPATAASRYDGWVGRINIGKNSVKMDKAISKYAVCVGWADHFFSMCLPQRRSCVRIVLG